MKNAVLDYMKEMGFKELKTVVDSMNVVDIADLFELMNKEQVIIAFRLMNKEKAGEVFVYLSSEKQQYIVESISDAEIKSIMNELFIDDTVDFLEEMPADVVNRVLKNTDDDTRKLINVFLKYPDSSAGSLMTTELVDLSIDMTIKESIDYIRKYGVDKETINNCYVIDKNRKLVGTISIRKLIISDSDALVKDLMDSELITVNTLTDQEEVADIFKKYDYTALPVVDKENYLVGIITVDDILDVIEQENTEDFQVMAGINPTEEEYLKTSVFHHVKTRIFWLFVLMVSAAISGAIIGRYEAILVSSAILATFIPMLCDTGGNCGAQSSTLIIRSMALGEIELKHTFLIIWKELRVSACVGILLATANFLRIYIFTSAPLNVTLVVSLTLLGTVVMAKIIGCVLPIFAKLCRIDPAVMAAPLITTVVDSFSLVLYFFLATKILHLVA
jgi:magnesium transporter